MSLPRLACLLAALLSATAALADIKGVANPPVFTPAELELINRDSRLIDATRICPWRLRRALDALHGQAARPTGAAVPCTDADDDVGRASNEGALDLLKLLKEAAGQGKAR
jgi:hypothetical protein